VKLGPQLPRPAAVDYARAIEIALRTNARSDALAVLVVNAGLVDLADVLPLREPRKPKELPPLPVAIVEIKPPKPTRADLPKRYGRPRHLTPWQRRHIKLRTRQGQIVPMNAKA
jgi:hypothetical protein